MHQQQLQQQHATAWSLPSCTLSKHRLVGNKESLQICSPRCVSSFPNAAAPAGQAAQACLCAHACELHALPLPFMQAGMREVEAAVFQMTSDLGKLKRRIDMLGTPRDTTQHRCARHLGCAAA